MSDPQPFVTVDVQGNVAVLKMDDGKANALTEKMIAELLSALDQAEAKGHAVVLAGRPGRYCAGFDLRTMMSGFDAARALFSKGGDLLMRLYTFPRPVVVACGGHALAGGALMVLVGDVRFCAAGEFKIGLNEVGIGLPLPILALEFARDRLLPTELTKATLCARVYDPDAALAAGYVDAVVPEGELLAAAIKEAARLGDFVPGPYAATKKRLREVTVARITATGVADLAELMPSST
jgi:enoyl-CoA hydratase